MHAGCNKMDEMAANKTSPPTSVQLRQEMASVSRRGSATAMPAHGSAPKLSISTKEKGIHRSRYLRRFSLNFAVQAPPGTSDTIKMAGGSAIVNTFPADPANTVEESAPGVYRTKLLKSPRSRLWRPSTGAAVRHNQDDRHFRNSEYLTFRSRQGARRMPGAT